MNKLEITKKVLSILNPSYTEDEYKKAFHEWWFSWRTKDNGGLRLTPEGYQSFLNAGIKDYKITLDRKIFFTNKLVIWLDQFIECPFFLTKEEIVVFSERMAIQLVLFSGNLYKYGAAKFESQKTD